MFRLACLSACCLTLLLGTLVREREARASDPVSVYTAVASVEMLPTDADATEVVIHGAFMFLNPTDGSYSDARCGYMYFRCQPGNETMCRMQWLEIRNFGTAASQCAGFGSMDKASTATVRAEGTALSAPDPWDLGVGVTPGSFIGGKCAPAKALTCALPPPADAGAPDVPVSTDAPSPTVDAPALEDAPVDQATGAMPDAGTATMDASTPPRKGKGGACAIGQAGDDLPIGISGGLALLAILLGAARVRRVR